MPRFGYLIALCAGLLALPLSAQPKTPVAIAAAADLRGVLEDIKAAFETEQPGLRLELSYGASGSLAAQIQQGAPFDVFLSADLGFPERLKGAGLVDEGGIFPYATGRLVLWVRRDLCPEPSQAALKLLRDPVFRRIALANPAVAPYGRAAEAALKASGLYDEVKGRLVLGENIAQAAQYLQTGAADAGLISQAQAARAALREGGFAWMVPQELYPPLRQGGVLLKRSPVPSQARAFKAFLLSPQGQALLARHGFEKP